ncbi:MAG: EpsI family protein [Bryobacterales bacterium]|jgi:EpsI family protein|nr:EpsI family protein [Bryobacterales bacterium]
MDIAAQARSLFKSKYALALSILLLAQLAIQLGYSRSEVVPPVPSLKEIPTSFAHWNLLQEGVIEQSIMDVLRADEAISRFYGDGQGYVSLFMAYFKSQRTGQAPHSPKNCLPGGGWTPTESGQVVIPLPDQGREIIVNKYLVTKGDTSSLVLYWYQSLDRVVASEYMAKIYLVADAIRHNRTDTALVRVVVPVGPDGPDRALAKGTDFIQRSFSAYQMYFPPAT